MLQDLESDRDTPEESAQEYAASIHVPYIETSAKVCYAFRLIN